eukprot:scaffold19884_cov30-Attheya_sp.AAC.2
MSLFMIGANSKLSQKFGHDAIESDTIKVTDADQFQKPTSSSGRPAGSDNDIQRGSPSFSSTTLQRTRTLSLFAKSTERTGSTVSTRFYDLVAQNSVHRTLPVGVARCTLKRGISFTGRN